MKFVVGSTSDSCIDECFESVRPTEQSACLNQVSVPRNEAPIFDIRISFMFVLLRGGLSISLIFLFFLCMRFLNEFHVFTPTIATFYTNRDMNIF